jgi:hypothetical protein
MRGARDALVPDIVGVGEQNETEDEDHRTEQHPLTLVPEMSEQRIERAHGETELRVDQREQEIAPGK